MNHYGREPEKREYASWIGISLAGVDKLEQFMFHGSVRSLDSTVPVQLTCRIDVITIGIVL
ncbi:MAG: hypothetical protein K0S47_4049 [Herbinix sp.]|jgi:hypothetical protein|nr:hypothetical protein [Herbinix sp.]